MGGEFDTRIYRGKHSKKEIEKLFKKDIDEALYDNGHSGYTGTIAEHEGQKIEWLKKIVATEERAEESIKDEQESKWDLPVGVFYDSVEGKGCVVGGWCSS